MSGPQHRQKVAAIFEEDVTSFSRERQLLERQLEAANQEIERISRELEAAQEIKHTLLANLQVLIEKEEFARAMAKQYRIDEPPAEPVTADSQVEPVVVELEKQAAPPVEQPSRRRRRRRKAEELTPPTQEVGEGEAEVASPETRVAPKVQRYGSDVQAAQVLKSMAAAQFIPATLEAMMDIVSATWRERNVRRGSETPVSLLEDLQRENSLFKARIAAEARKIGLILNQATAPEAQIQNSLVQEAEALRPRYQEIVSRLEGWGIQV